MCDWIGVTESSLASFRTLPLSSPVGLLLEPIRSIPSSCDSRSVRDDHVICLEDGKKLKMLKRHLMADHGLTPEEYRAKWGLPRNYPMVAPAYARTRQELAKKIGLGRKPAAPKRGRKKK